MTLVIAFVLGFVGGGLVIGALIPVVWKVKVSSEITALAADVKAELAKVSPDLTALKTKASALVAKL
jgi:hypothetical protein